MTLSKGALWRLRRRVSTTRLDFTHGRATGSVDRKHLRQKRPEGDSGGEEPFPAEGAQRGAVPAPVGNQPAEDRPHLSDQPGPECLPEGTAASARR
jgi:hypothetical protein